MIVFPTLDNFSVGTISTRGSSETAKFVVETEKEEYRKFKESFSLGLGIERLCTDLLSLYGESRTPNWDSYDANPISEEALEYAGRFLEALPLGTPLPEIGAEPSGYVTFEWYLSPRRTLSISVSPNGDLHYAALLGIRKAYGTEPFFGEVPVAILTLIHQIKSI